MEGLLRLLAAVLEVSSISRAHVSALEISHEGLMEVCLALYAIGRKMLQPCTDRVGQVQGKVAYNEVVIVCAAGLASKLVVLKPKAEVQFPKVFEDVCR